MVEPQTIRRDLYAQVTDAIIAALEAGTPPWRRPWNPDEVGVGGPINAISGHRYRGINVLLLGMSAKMATSSDPRWMSYKQASDKHWQVRRGERASTVLFFKRVPLNDGSRSEANEDPRTVPLLRSYPVFHASQVDGIPDYTPPDVSEAPWQTPESASIILNHSGAIVRESGDQAFYSPSGDFIQMPPKAAFTSAPAWAATMMHELGHWSGNSARLDRNLSSRFGTHAYAQEELRAELASAFIGSELGIPAAIERHASYVESWLKVLRQDKREIFRAAADAQRMADYLLNFHPAYAARVTIAQLADRETTETPSSPVGMPGAAMPAHIRRSLGRDQRDVTAETPPPPGDNPAPAFRPR